MSEEIERKFLVKEMPNLDGFKPLSYERYFLFKNRFVEIRVQKRGDIYEFERKENQNNLSTKKIKFEISRDEFLKLKENSVNFIRRKSYIISKNPSITIKVYDEKHCDLRRIEVEFDSELDAEKFVPLKWFGKKITNSKLGRDSKLIDLSKEEILDLIQ